MIAKGCPKCEQQVPVACKACPCGHSFFSARRTAKVSQEVDIRRRTQRVRREKPNYYDSLEYEKQIRKAKTRHSESTNEEDSTSKKDNGKSKRKKIKKEDDEEDESISNLPTSKQYQCQIILDEINMKLQFVTWKPSICI